MCSLDITVSSHLLVRGQVIKSFNFGNMQFIFRKLVPHWLQNSHTYLSARDCKSEKGMSSSKMAPTRASLAAESAAELPLMPTWTGTQIKTVSLPSLVSYTCSSKTFIRIRWSDFRLDIAWREGNESDNTRDDFSLESSICLRAKRIARSSAVNIELSSGSRQVKDLRICLVEAAAAAIPSSIFEPSVKMCYQRGIFCDKL